MFYYKKFNKGNEVLLAICDKDLIGKKIEDKDVCIEIKEEFYGNETCDKEKALELLKDCTMINAAGENVISFLVDNGIVDSEYVIRIKQIPHAQVVVV